VYEKCEDDEGCEEWAQTTFHRCLGPGYGVFFSFVLSLLSKRRLINFTGVPCVRGLLRRRAMRRMGPDDDETSSGRMVCFFPVHSYFSANLTTSY